MSNTTGQLFRVTTFGESHGPAIGCVIDGCPPGIPVAAEDFARDLERRATGRSRHTSARREQDAVEILSGVYEGMTTGAPLALLVRNTDARSKDYDRIASQFRPGHADYTWWQKYGIRDPRGGGRSSARETTMRVAAAVVAKKWLAERHGVRVRGHLAQIGGIVPRGHDWAAVEDNPFFWPDAAQVPELEAYMDALRKSGDSVGARVRVPFGNGERIGWVARVDAGGQDDQAKAVIEFPDSEPVVTPELMRLCRWVAEYYLTPLGQVLRSATPAALSARSTAFVELARTPAADEPLTDLDRVLLDAHPGTSTVSEPAAGQRKMRGVSIPGSYSVHLARGIASPWSAVKRNQVSANTRG